MGEPDTTDSRYTPGAILASTPEGTATGERYCEMALTALTVATIPPYGRMQVVSYLRTLLNREPVRSDPWYAAHNAILGAVIVDLEGYAIRDGADGIEPPSLVDLREPRLVSRERDMIRGMREWSTQEQARRAEIYHAGIDDILADSAKDHEAAEASLTAAVAAATTPVEPALDAEPF